MASIFPPPIQQLPQADLPVLGVAGYILQGEAHQIVFMEFDQDTDIPEHAHESQWEIVLEG